MPTDKEIEAVVEKLSIDEKEGELPQEDVNPQVMPMTAESIRALPPKNGIPREAFDYGEPVRDAAWFKRRCHALGLFFEDEVYEVMYLHDTLGIRRKEYKAILKRQKKKRGAAVVHEPTILSF
jgi:hypothetical protein